MATKLQKEIEVDIHEQLYSNIFMLTLKYPTTKEFNACFKKDMFIKNNKSAYLHVVHFLLNILDPTYFKQRNHIWPALDAKMETQFRNELMKYVNELNSTNKETGIPLLMTSHLISPGGYRFAEFIFRLSQFVLSEHIKRETGNDFIPFPPKATNNYIFASEQVKNMEKINYDQYKNLIQKQKIFELKLKAAKDSILNIRSQEPVLKQETKEIEEKIEGYFKSNESQISNVLKTLPREGLIDGKLNKIESDTLIFQKCSTLIDILNENKNTVDSIIEINTSSHQTKTNDVDLIEYFEALLESLKDNKFAIKTRNDSYLPEHVQTSLEIKTDLSEHNDKYEELKTELELSISHLKGSNSNLTNGGLHKYEALSQKVRNAF